LSAGEKAASRLVLFRLAAALRIFEQLVEIVGAPPHQRCDGQQHGNDEVNFGVSRAPQSARSKNPARPVCARS
jgi:hypothetical protein